MLHLESKKYFSSESGIRVVYRYGFNGKDRESEFSSGAYDFGARIHDARLGRWLSTDPLSCKYPYSGTFGFCLNNPIINYDPDGRLVRPINEATFAALKSYLVKSAGNNDGLKQAFGNLQYAPIGTIDGNPVMGIDVSSMPNKAAFRKMLNADNEISMDQKLAMLAWYNAITDTEVVIEFAYLDGTGTEQNVNDAGSTGERKLGDDGIPISTSSAFNDYTSTVRSVSADNSKSDAQRDAETLAAQKTLLGQDESEYYANQGKMVVPGTCTTTTTQTTDDQGRITSVSSDEDCLYTGTDSPLIQNNTNSKIPVVGISFITPQANMNAVISDIMVNRLSRSIKLFTEQPGTKKNTVLKTSHTLNGDGTVQEKTVEEKTN